MKEKKNYKSFIITALILIPVITLLYFLLNNFLADQAFEKGVLEYRRAIGFMSEYFGNFGSRGISTVQTPFKESLKKFEKYVRVRKKDPKGYFMIGNSCYMLYKTDIMFLEKTGGNKKDLSEDNLNKAIEAFNRSISYKEEYAEAHYCLAMCYMHRDFLVSYRELNKAKKYIDESPDKEKKSVLAKTIEKALEGFPEIKSEEDNTLAGTVIKCTVMNNENPVYIAVITPGKTIPDPEEMTCLFSKEDIFTIDLLPGKSYLLIIISNNYAITGIIEGKTKTLYTFNIKPLADNFAIYDPKIMEEKI